MLHAWLAQDCSLRFILRAAVLENGWELLRSEHTGALLTSRGVRRYVQISIAPSRSREKVPKSFPPSHTGVTAVTAVTAGAPWRFARPILRDNGRVLGLGHQVPYTHYLPWPGDQPGRPSWPWKCAYVRSTAMLRGRVRVLRGGIGGKLRCDFFVLSVPAAVGHCFMSILTRPNR